MSKDSKEQGQVRGIEHDSVQIGHLLNALLNELRIVVNNTQDFQRLHAWVKAQEVALALRDGTLKLKEGVEDDSE